jgi:hypothetical protein
VGTILSSTVAYAALPVAVPNTTVALLAQERHADICWSIFRILSLAIPLVILFTGIAARLRRTCQRIAGLVVVAVFCGLQSYDIQWSPVPNSLNGVGVSWPFAPNGSHSTMSMALRALLNLGLTMTLFAFWKSRQPRYE